VNLPFADGAKVPITGSNPFLVEREKLPVGDGTKAPFVLKFPRAVCMKEGCDMNAELEEPWLDMPGRIDVEPNPLNPENAWLGMAECVGAEPKLLNQADPWLGMAECIGAEPKLLNPEEPWLGMADCIGIEAGRTPPPRRPCAPTVPTLINKPTTATLASRPADRVM
jgi:hypothetical protein